MMRGKYIWLLCVSVLFSGILRGQDTLADNTDTLIRQLNIVEIEGKNDNEFGISRLKQIEGTSIYAGKKSEVVVLGDLTVNTATNNSRQVYGKIAGLNIWESDGAGIQLGIGGRGLNPNRVSNFNTRQNGYDISADALGYPESYYTPPVEALERIEVVRGAASLQYGTQFGGFVNFKMKQGVENKKISATVRQSLGSFGFYNAFTSIGGTVKNINYYTCYQYKSGDGWRPNSHFDAHTAFAGIKYKAGNKLTLGFEYTYMNYLAKQAGGLTDRQFQLNPRQSNRSRNWFRVNWNLAAVNLDYKISERSRLNWRTFGLYAQRDALGNLGRIDRPDNDAERDYLQDKFRNVGSELRFLTHYPLGIANSATLLVGGRYYNGNTHRKQGFGSANADADFQFLNPNELEHSDYTFPSQNIALFVENVFRITKRLNITPGLRYEYISTRSEGYFNEEYRDLAGNLLYKQKTTDNRNNVRDFVLAGIGIGYRMHKNLESYANISQNYRSINFSDMRIVNPNARVDPNLKDEDGFSADFGIRGNKKEWLNFDFSVFYLKYNDRIGSIQKADSNTFQIYRFRTNISDSRNAGIESFVEVNLYKLLSGSNKNISITVFSNYALLHATYSSSQEKSVQTGNRVEYVPKHILRTGITAGVYGFKASVQHSYTSAQFTEATNAVFTTSAVDGIIPAYSVTDISFIYTYKRYSVSGSINNLFNRYYFTRRADGYPGPGIIPADGRGFYLSVQVNLF